MYEDILIEKAKQFVKDCEGQIQNISVREKVGEITENEAKAAKKTCNECKAAFEDEIEYLKDFHQPVEAFWPTQRTVDALRKIYEEGARVRLVEFKDAFANIPEGTLGTVIYVDDSGTIHVNWDKKGEMGMVHLVDVIEKVYRTEVALSLEEEVCVFLEVPANPDIKEIEGMALDKYSDGAYSTNSFEVARLWHSGMID